MQTYTYVFERHQMINEENTFALEQFPYCFAPFPFRLAHLERPVIR